MKIGRPLGLVFYRKHMRFQLEEGELLKGGLGEGGLPEGTWEGEGHCRKRVDQGRGYSFFRRRNVVE
jgi:hypothetical protein